MTDSDFDLGVSPCPTRAQVRLDGRMASPGRKLKGGVERTRIMVRLLPDIHEEYQRLGRELGLPMTDVIAYLSAKGAGHPVPAYIEEAIRQHKEQLEAERSNQPALVAS